MTEEIYQCVGCKFEGNYVDITEHVKTCPHPIKLLKPPKQDPKDNEKS